MRKRTLILRVVAGGLLWPSVGRADDGGGLAGGLGSMLPFLLMFAVIYFLMMRPAQKQRKEQDDMLSSLKRDDEVVTQSGLIGKIVAVEPDVVTLELAERVRVRMLRERIAGLWDGGPAKRNLASTTARKQGVS